jgi:hypothetical protein
MSLLLKSILMLQKAIIQPQARMPHSMNHNVLEFLQNDSDIVNLTKSTVFKGVADGLKRILINNFDAAVSSSPQ